MLYMSFRQSEALRSRKRIKNVLAREHATRGRGLEPAFTPAAFDKQVFDLIPLITKTPRESFTLRTLPVRRIINNIFTVYLSNQTIDTKSVSYSHPLLKQVGDKLLKLGSVISPDIESILSRCNAAEVGAYHFFEALLDFID